MPEELLPEEPDPEELLPEEPLPEDRRDFFVLFDFEPEELPDVPELLPEDAAELLPEDTPAAADEDEEAAEPAVPAEEDEASDTSDPVAVESEESGESASAEASAEGSDVTVSEASVPVCAEEPASSSEPVWITGMTKDPASVSNQVSSPEAELPGIQDTSQPSRSDPAVKEKAESDEDRICSGEPGSVMRNRFICAPSPLHDTVTKTETSVSLSAWADAVNVQNSGTMTISCEEDSPSELSSVAKEDAGEPASRPRHRPVIRSD